MHRNMSVSALSLYLILPLWGLSSIKVGDSSFYEDIGLERRILLWISQSARHNTNTIM